MSRTPLTDAAELKLSRLVVLLVGAAAILIALASGEIIPLLVFAFTVRSAGPFAAFIFSLIWKRTSRMAGLVSIIVGTVAGIWWKLANPAVPGIGPMDPIIPASLAGVTVFLVIHVIDARRGNLTGDAWSGENADASAPAEGTR